MIEIKLNDSEVQKVFTNIDKYDAKVKAKVNDQIATSAFAIHRNAIGILKSNLKTTSRRLESSLRPILNRSTYSGEVMTDYFVAPFIESGTKPHIIKPRNAKVLRWGTPAVAMSVKSHVRSYRTRGGELSQAKQYAFSMIVHHPGTKPIEFLKKSADRERPKYIQRIINILNK